MEQGAGSKEQGAGSGEQGARSGEQGAGSREQGAGSRKKLLLVNPHFVSGPLVTSRKRVKRWTLTSFRSGPHVATGSSMLQVRARSFVSAHPHFVQVRATRC
ncbi:MAG: hypothetical protein ABSF90_18540, partial [Syntrophobacteraceae bacterium]